MKREPTTGDREKIGSAVAADRINSALYFGHAEPSDSTYPPSQRPTTRLRLGWHQEDLSAIGAAHLGTGRKAAYIDDTPGKRA